MAEIAYLFHKDYLTDESGQKYYASPYLARVQDTGVQGRIAALASGWVTNITALEDVPGQISDLAALIAMAGVLFYPLKATMVANTGEADETLALVFNDSTGSNNGLYISASGAWSLTTLQLANAADLAAKADAATTISGGGLATGGGDLSANRTITVTEASEVEAQAGTAFDVVMTPRRTADHALQYLTDLGIVSDSANPDILGTISDEDGKLFMQFLRGGGIKLLDSVFRAFGGLSEDMFSITDENKKRLFALSSHFADLFGLQISQPDVGDDVLSLTDSAGKVIAAVGGRGEVRFVQERLPADLAADFGARGAVFNVRRDRGNLVAFDSNILGYTAPFVFDRTVANPARVYSGDAEAEIHIDYGQSWRADLLDSTGIAGLVGLSLPELVLGLRDVDGAVYTSYNATLANTVFDLSGLEPDATGYSIGDAVDNIGGISIGRAAALTYQRLCLANTKHIRPVITLGSPRPGSWWTETANSGASGDYIDATSLAWTTQNALIAAAGSVLRDKYGMRPRVSCVGFTHGALSDALATASGESYRDHLDDMLAQYKALALPQGGDVLHIFTDQTPTTGNSSEGRASMMDQVEFAADNSTVVHLIGPRYAYAYRSDNIHHDAAAYLRIGELEGLVKYKVLRAGETWTPCKVTNISPSGAVLTVTCADPFGNGTLAEDSTTIAAATDGTPITIKGWRVKVDGVDATLVSVTLSGLTITVTLDTAPTTGQSVEVSYAWYRPDGVADDADRAGTWGNFKSTGPASLYFAGETVDTWLCAHKETYVAA